jgi:hypothetical protein
VYLDFDVALKPGHVNQVRSAWRCARKPVDGGIGVGVECRVSGVGGGCGCGCGGGSLESREGANARDGAAAASRTLGPLRARARADRVGASLSLFLLGGPLTYFNYLHVTRRKRKAARVPPPLLPPPPQPSIFFFLLSAPRRSCKDSI